MLIYFDVASYEWSNNQYINESIYFVKNNTINNMILFWESKKINVYDCHDCHVFSLIGGDTGITLLSVGILKNIDL